MKKLFVVGLGPGAEAQMTARARAALAEADVLCGYTVYVDLVAPLYPGKSILTTPMRRETERCRLAFSEASKGRTTAMICSGDAGVYGMAGLILELSAQYPVMHSVMPPVPSLPWSGWPDTIFHVHFWNIIPFYCLRRTVQRPRPVTCLRCHPPSGPPSPHTDPQQRALPCPLRFLPAH